MKRAIITVLAIMMLASSSFAGVSFLTANSVGVGKWAVLGMYATNHIGDNGGSNQDPSWLDSNSIGVRGEYGVMKDLDLLVAYSIDTLNNLKSFEMSDSLKQTSGNTMSLGAKYTFMKAGALDVAALLGYESSSSGIKSDVGSMTLGMTTIGIGCIISQKMGIMMPYASVGYKMLTQAANKFSEEIGGNSLAFNVGTYIGIAEDQAVAIEYNTENRAWADAKGKGPLAGTKSGETADSVSGISLGYVYMF